MKIIDQNVVVDQTEKTILTYLMRDAKMPVLEVARSIGITGAAVHQRLRKLEKAGLIKGSKLVVDPRILGYTTMAFVGIYLDKAINIPKVVEDLSAIPEVLECHYTTGNWSLLVKLLCENNEQLMRILNESIQNIESVARTETFLSLDQQINRQVRL